jgi:hypothetical protein
MEEGKYLEVQMQLETLAGIVHDIPLKEFLEAAEVADAVGPILDPTLWIRANRNLKRIKALAYKLQTFQEEAKSWEDKTAAGTK